MSINNVNNVGSNSPVQKAAAQPLQKQVPTDAPAQVRAHDRVELSGVGHLIKALKTNDVRGEKVASIKAQIAAGTYETDQKIDGAVDKLLDELGK